MNHYNLAYHDAYLQKVGENGLLRKIVGAPTVSGATLEGMAGEGAEAPVDGWDALANQLNDDKVFAAATGENRPYLTAGGLGLAGAGIGGIFGGGKGALMGGALGAILGFVMEAFNLGADDAWGWVADKRAKGILGDALKKEAGPEYEKRTGKSSEQGLQEHAARAKSPQQRTRQRSAHARSAAAHEGNVRKFQETGQAAASAAATPIPARPPQETSRQRYNRELRQARVQGKRFEANKAHEASTERFLKSRAARTTKPGSMRLDAPIDLKPDASKQFTRMNLDKGASMQPWQQILQKQAEIGPAAAPTQQPAAPMQVEDTGPSKSDVWQHQAKMQEMAGQKALIDAKAQAEATKAQSAASTAATKAQEGMNAGQNPQQTGVNGGAQAGDANQMAQAGMQPTQGMQPAAEMPTAQWGQPQG